MNNKDRLPKAIAVYDAVLRLIEEGCDITSLTVSAIAKAAGIGKGTTYDYFSSKDEIIAKSLIYGYRLLMDDIIENISKKESLKEKLSALMETSLQYSHMSSMFEQAVNIVSTSREMQNQIYSVFADEKIAKSYFIKLIDELKAAADNEGILGDGYDVDYVSYVLFTVIHTAFGPVSCKLSREGWLETAQQAEYLYKMICQTLS